MIQACIFQPPLSKEQQGAVPIGAWGETNQTLSINQLHFRNWRPGKVKIFCSDMSFRWNLYLKASELFYNFYLMFHFHLTTTVYYHINITLFASPVCLHVVNMAATLCSTAIIFASATNNVLVLPRQNMMLLDASFTVRCWHLHFVSPAGRTANVKMLRFPPHFY